MKSKNFKNWNKKQGRLLYDHIVFHVKYNRPMLVDYIAIKAKEIICDLLKDFNCEAIEINVQPNHVHLLFSYPPTIAPSDVVKRVKNMSSTLLRRQFPELVNQCPKALWNSYVHHMSVGHDIKSIRIYIKTQNKHHKYKTGGR